MVHYTGIEVKNGIILCRSAKFLWFCLVADSDSGDVVLFWMSLGVCTLIVFGIEKFEGVWNGEVLLLNG